MAIILDSTRSVVIVLSAAKTSNDCAFVCSYADRTTTTFTEGFNDGNTNGTTEVTLVAAPFAGTNRIVDEIVIANYDTSNVTINIKYKNSTGPTYKYIINSFTLLPTDIWRWSKGEISISSFYNSISPTIPALTAEDNSSIDVSLIAWTKYQALLNLSINSGTAFSTPIVSTYSLVYTVATAYRGGVLAPNGGIHFIPLSAAVGQKINSLGTVSTYSLVYTTASAYSGGVLAPNGDINFVSLDAYMYQEQDCMHDVRLGV